ncbi:MAG: prepilin peptidase [Parvibaculales bacterium]
MRSIKNLLFIGQIDPGECHTRESQRLRSLYWRVQFALGALLPLAFWRLGADNFPAAVSLIVLLSFIFLTDLEAFIIPDHGSLGGTIIGLMFAVLEIPGLPNLRQALLGGLCGFALIFSINALYHLWRGRDGMGFGDVKLMAMLGVWLGPESLLPILFVASMAGVVFGCAMTLAGAKHHGLGLVKVPFGCFLTMASIAWLLFIRF